MTEFTFRGNLKTLQYYLDDRGKPHYYWRGGVPDWEKFQHGHVRISHYSGSAYDFARVTIERDDDQTWDTKDPMYLGRDPNGVCWYFRIDGKYKTVSNGWGDEMEFIPGRISNGKVVAGV